MCRNIRTLHHFEPPATQEELQASALQFVRKLTGMNAPSKHNQKPFDKAVAKVVAATNELFASLEAHGPPRDRELQKQQAQARGQKRDAAMRRKLLAEAKTG
jgi:hypothetical protein